MNDEPFYTGKVSMFACDKVEDRYTYGRYDLVAGPVEFDHSTREGRNEVRKFVHEHLCLGHTVMTKPLD